ncbi:SusD/RagB family nutrient-binding outer membrane lipoprotein [Fodinibius saliphilus]|uniref:SusD/RagB family nutrient-binding outer membrane lipoprotein n=1 Tax=Fodinibius saliphilus TaxID=1920650 RepID=UPI001109BFE6|nr:SusD/RagB family nutrient-binding outer membrane lipoprotein [Fodinibius saliphilus]
MIFTKPKLLIIGLLLVGIMGCDSVTSSFTDGYSENPNNPTTAPADKIFTAGQVATVTFLETHGARKGSMWAQYFSGEDRQYSSIYSYTVTASDASSDWFLAYTRGLTNLRLARDKYQDRNVVPANQVAATKMLEAMLMGQVTALWGDVPYTEAINADSIAQPAYDSQADVYADVIDLLDDAITTFSNNSSVAIANDVTTLNGNTSKWLKVAYTLKARYLMHTGNATAAATAASNGIDANDGSGDMMMPHGNQQGRNQNLYYNFTVVQRAGYLAADRSHSRQMLINGNNSKTDETDRLNYFYDGTNLNNSGFAADTESFPIVTYMENELIKAQIEAAKGTTTGDNNAITALNNTRDYLDNKFGTTNYDDLALTDFQAGGAYAGTSIPQHVRNWSYLGLIGQIEGFNYVRRIDYNVDGLSPVQGSQFPQRFLYPQSERNTNENVPSPAPGLFDKTPVNS